jgi:hypothetical protein
MNAGKGTLACLVLATTAMITGCSKAPDPRPGEPRFLSYSGQPALSPRGGRAVSTTFAWQAAPGVQLGPTASRRNPRPSDFVWCTLARPGMPPSDADTCRSFDSVECTLVNPNDYGRYFSCEGAVTVPRDLQGNAGSWYVRARDPRNPEAVANSNVLGFAWSGGGR